MKKKTIAIACGIAAVLLAAGFFAGYAIAPASAASNYGSQDDPLVSLSYLTQQLTPSLMNQFNGSLNDAVNRLESEMQSGSGVTTTYCVVTLSAGQTLTGKAGTEILLREGSAAVQGGVMLVDTTGGGVLSSGAALTANHLGMFTDDGGQIQASGDVRLLVRGSYTVN
ncbi:MAG: hypothetical protein FWC62_04535 [Firmicutes bacterium]|nr:hypothetical protein [Bacillota bacterium]